MFYMLTQLSIEFQLLLTTKMLKKKNVLIVVTVFILLIDIKMPTIVGILAFISRISFMLN